MFNIIHPSLVHLDEKLATYVDMRMDLLQQSPLDEKYCHSAVEGLTRLFSSPWEGGGGREPYVVCQIFIV